MWVCLLGFMNVSVQSWRMACGSTSHPAIPRSVLAHGQMQMDKVRAKHPNDTTLPLKGSWDPMRAGINETNLVVASTDFGELG
jgi:hypothetical protein